jgi:hypothetical protein
MALQGTDPSPLTAPFSSAAAAAIQHAQGVTTTQGDVNLAGRDVHVHKHYHQVSRRTWRLAATRHDIDNESQASDEVTHDSHFLKSTERRPLEDEPHPHQRRLALTVGDGSVPFDNTRSLPQAEAR